MNVPAHILHQFNLHGEPISIPGGELRTFKVGNTIVKHINNDSLEYTKWTAEFFNSINENGFRVAKPITTKEGLWLTSDGWSAWEFIEGNHNYENHIEESIKAITAFHQAIKDYPKPAFIGVNDNHFTRADYYSWNEKPLVVQKEVAEDVNLLYNLRLPLGEYTEQLIHGDLNPDNILVSEKLPPVIIDIAPYWRPAEFALAVYAYWIGPWQGNEDRLKYFANVPNFNQMLIRVGIRMLLILSELRNITDLEKYQQATRIIQKYIKL